MPILPNDEEIQRVAKELTECETVRAVLESRGWQEYISPTIEKTISEIIGGKEQTHWKIGKLQRARKEEKKDWYLGYVHALMDLVNLLQAKSTAVEEKKTRIQDLKNESGGVYKMPMEDSPYAV